MRAHELERCVSTARRALRWAEVHPRTVGFVAIGVAVLGFSGAWPGQIVLDGPGTTVHLRLAVDHLQHGGGVPYWTSEMWAGTPSWALAPSLPILAMLPLAILIGPVGAMKLAILAAQVAGGWGAFILAQSLWGRRALLTPLAAGVLYALHPLFISHGALFGHATSAFVMATTPWLVWSLRKALRGDGGARYAVLSGLFAGLIVLEHAEHAYALVPIGLCQTAIELWRARKVSGRGTGRPGTGRRIARQALIMVAVAVGATAFWLAPFASMGKSFILTPNSFARSELVTGEGSQLGHEPGTFLTRAAPITQTVTFEQSLFKGNFYLGWMCLVPTLLTAFLVARHDRDGHLTALLVAGGIDIWLSTAGVPLADSGPAQRIQPLPFIVVGVVTGLLVGSFIRRVASGRTAVLWGGVTCVLLVTIPYVAPLIALRDFVPGLASIRFPRFYPVAALSLALGAAYPLRFVPRWAARRRPDLARLLTTAATLALIGTFLVDVHPYRTFYRAHGPDDRVAYAQARTSLQALGSDFRVTTGDFGDPRKVESLLGTGFDLSVGWPHPIAGKQTWRLTAEPVISPPTYRQAALGLSNTAYIATEATRPGDPGQLLGVQLERNPLVLPIARAYGQAVVVADSNITAELAVALAARHMSVVTGGPAEARELAAIPVRRLADSDECRTARAADPLRQNVAMACALHNWIGVFAALDFVPVGDTGALFRPIENGLSGVSVWLDRDATTTEMVVHEVTPGGSLAAEVARSTPVPGDADENGMTAFRFPPVPASAGHTYAFSLTCASCGPGEEPRMVVTTEPRAAGDLVEGGHVDRQRGVAFSTIYAGMDAAPPVDTQVTTTSLGPGRWQLDVSGSGPSLVVLAESWFPGWTSTVDGVPTHVLQADGAFLGVPVGPGTHRIELTYKLPAAAKVGRLVTAGTLGLALAAAPLSRRRTGPSRRSRRARGSAPAGLGEPRRRRRRNAGSRDIASDAATEAAPLG